MKKKFTFMMAACIMLLAMMILPGKAVGQDRVNFSGTFTKITSTSDLTTGFYVITGSESASTSNKAMGNSVSNGRVSGVTVTISSNTITNPSEDVVYYITKNGDNYTFKNIGNGKYLYQSSTTSGKGLGFQNASANITLDGYNGSSPIGFKFVLNESSNNRLKWNNSSSWFSNYDNNGYTTSMSPVRLFKCPAYTVTYNPVSGSGTGSGTMTDSNNPYASGATVTVQACTFTAPTGMDFVHWNTKADGTGISYDADDTFTISENTTLYAIWSAGSSVATPTFTVGSGTYNVDQSVEINCETDGAAIYYTLDGSKPNASSTLYEGAVSITETKTLKAIAIKNDESSNVAMATYTMKCATPTFNLPTGTYEGTQTIEIECATSDVTIYYTNTGADPSSYSTQYSEPFELTSNKTIKAIAKRTNWTDSEIAEATYTIINPLMTMDAVFTASATSGTYYVKFNNYVISAVRSGSPSSKAYITDGEKGFIINKSGHNFSVGDILSGTVSCSLSRSSGAPQSTTLTSSAENLTVTPGGTVSVANIALADLSGVNTGALISYTDLSYNGTYLSDGTTDIKPYSDLTSISSIQSGHKYHVTGIYLQYNSTKEILPRSASDIKLAAQMTAPTFDAFSYLVADGGPATQNKSISGTDFSADLLVTAPANYQVSNDGETWASTVTYTPNGSKAISGTLYVRLVSGLEVGTYNGDLTFTADGYLTPQTVALSGTVSASTTYAISLNQTTGGTISSDKAVAEAGQIVTLSYTDLDDCYTFNGWTVLDGDANPVTVNNNQFTMPASDVEVEGIFTQKTFTVQYSVNGTVVNTLTESVNCGNDAALPTSGFTVPTGYTFAGWSTAANNTAVVSSYTPDDNITLYAVLFQSGSSLDYVKVTEDLTDWSGEYLIVYEDGNVAFDGSLITLDATSNTIGVTINSDVIDSNATNDASTFTITNKGNNNYSLKSKSGKYIGHTGSSNALKTSDTDDYDNTISFSNNVVTITCNNYKLKYNKSSGQTRFRYFGSGQEDIQLYKKQTPTAYTLVEDITTDASLPSIEPTYLITVKDGATLTVTGDSNGDETNLIIEDGGQLITSNSVKATLKKTTTASTEAKTATTYWYAISSPIDEIAISTFATGTHNVYSYIEKSHYWNEYRGAENITLGTAPFTKLANGRGYLYRSTASGIDFKGDVNIEDATYTLSYTAENGDLAGFNLIGNPFSYNIYKGVDIPNTDLEGNFYTLTPSGGWELGYDSGAAEPTEIKPNTGILVQAKSTADGQTLTIAKTRNGGVSKYDNDQISFKVENSDYYDVACVQFKDGRGLNKIEHRNAEIPMLYIMNNGENFGAANMPDNTSVINLGFEAKTMGEYTISLKAEGQYSYMHLIDKLTGEDIDMLVEDSYTFIGSQNDRKDRFVLNLNYNAAGIDSESDIFAYQSGNEIIVNGEGTLEVFDVTGRKVMATTINGVQTVNGLNNGFYIFRLNEKTQKIVVR